MEISRREAGATAVLADRHGEQAEAGAMVDGRFFANPARCPELESGGVRCDLLAGHLADGIRHWIAPSNIDAELAGNGYAPPPHEQIEQERAAFLATQSPTQQQDR